MTAFFHTHLPRIWASHSLWAWLLLPIAWAYGAAVAMRRGAYARGWLTSGHAGVATVVVGNVVAGGAGKTPTTMALVQHLQSRGLCVGVVSRGHGRSSTGVQAVHADSSPTQVGDEPLLIHQRTQAPVWVGRQRLQAAQALRQAHPQVQVLVCDDGLQHTALQRDLEICVMDDRGVGNGWLLPAGPLREPWPRAVDVLLVTHSPPNAHAAKLAPHAHTAARQLAPVAVNGWGHTHLLSDWAGTTADAVAGLARPQAFFDMLQASGVVLGQCCALPDHASFDGWAYTPQPHRPLLCTEKDAAKLWRQHPQAWAVGLQLEIAPSFWQAIDDWLRLRGLWTGQPHDAALAPNTSD